MTPDLLRRIGEALYGPRWQSDLAAALGVNNRTLRRWVAGAAEMPDTLPIDLYNLAHERLRLIGAVADELLSVYN